MAEQPETMPDKEADNSVATEAAAEPPPAVEPAPKKRGRPKGAADKAPRKKRIAIVAEPIAAPVQEQVPPAPAPAKKVRAAAKADAKAAPTPEEPSEPSPPPTPRTILRAASQHILELQTLKANARKNHLSEAYTKKLHRI